MNPRPSASRAFTLIEVMLAGTLGLIVIFAAMAFFTSMDRAKKMQQERLENNVEMATAHRVIQQALRSLLMNDGANIRDDEQKERIAQNLRDAEANPLSRDPDAAKARLALQPDLSATTADGRPTQSLELTLITPPIHAVTMLSENERIEEAELREMIKLRRRQLHLFNDSAYKTSGTDAKGSGSKLPESSFDDPKAAAASETEAQRRAARAERLRNASTGLTGKDADPLALDEAASRELEAPRAPGVRGVFELRPEDDPKVLARLREAAGGTEVQGTALALWWRQIPLEDGLAGEDENGNPITDPLLLDLARRSRTDSPQIKLLTGLRAAEWQVYRRRKMVPKMMASTAKELPAYVEFKFETLSGRREDWLFEVAWSYGADPGTVVAANDILGGPGDALANGIPGVNGLPADLQGLINKAVAAGSPNGVPPTGVPTNVGGGKPTSVTGNTGGGSQSNRPVTQGGTGGGGSTTPRPGSIPGGGANGATQAEIDAILRQFGFRR